MVQHWRGRVGVNTRVGRGVTLGVGGGVRLGGREGCKTRGGIGWCK